MAPPPPPPPLRVLVLTFPAHGHYMTIRDVAVGLARRGHAVTFALCEQSRAAFDADALAARENVTFLSAGPCPTYDRREDALRELIRAPGDLAAVARVLDGVAALGAEMCDALLPRLLAAPRAEWPHVVVFDADSYCGLDLGAALRLPVVARVGTGLRDAHTTPLYAPLFSGGAAAPHGPLARAANAALVQLTRHVLAPLLLPRVYSRHRARLVAAADAQLAARGGGAPAAELAAALGGGGAGAPPPAVLARFLRHRAGAMRPDLPWDGHPALYNSHWGLEYPRPTQPFEHLVGHTTDFAAEAARPLPPAVAAALDAAGVGRVVYVAMGSLSVLPPAWLHSLAAAVVRVLEEGEAAAGERAADDGGGGGGGGALLRVLWVVPAAQRGALPRSVARFVADGSLLLADWLPQTAALAHPSVGAFVTHGGMNSVGEATFARAPMLCVPLFSDQPDNCARVADRGLGLALDAGLRSGGARGGLDAAAFAAAVATLLDPARHAEFTAALGRAWVANVAAGGIPRAVQLVEAAAAAGWGGHLAALPAPYHQPWHEAAGLDVAAVLAACALAALLLARAAARGARALCARAAAAAARPPRGDEKRKRQ
jgi:hypothetical protein